jgi:hypothetical protein
VVENPLHRRSYWLHPDGGFVVTNRVRVCAFKQVDLSWKEVSREEFEAHFDRKRERTAGESGTCQQSESTVSTSD